MTTEPLLLPPKEAAKVLGICERTLRSLKADGEIAFVPIRGAIRYDVADLRTFIEAKKIATSPRATPAPC